MGGVYEVTMSAAFLCLNTAKKKLDIARTAFANLVYDNPAKVKAQLLNLYIGIMVAVYLQC